MTFRQSSSELQRRLPAPGVPRAFKEFLDSEREQIAQGSLNDHAALLFATRISVCGRWLIGAILVGLLVYRPDLWYPQAAEYVILPIALLIVNGSAHYLSFVKRQVSLRMIAGLCVFDIALITVGVVIGGGVTGYSFLAYYPAIAYFAVICSSPWLGGVWTAGVAVVYLVACALAGSGIELDAGKEKLLAARVAAMLIIALAIGMLTRFERLRWQRAIQRERRLRERIVELSRNIHDSTAQTVAMINVGLYRAKTQAASSNGELMATLESTADLTRSALWNLRGPIDAGQTVSDKPISRILWSHCATFERITSQSTELRLQGLEPELSEEAKAALLSIAHNALTNVSLHARSRSVVVELRFEDEAVALSVTDDGVGLPPDYAERGRGFNGMRIEAERLGGELTVRRGADESGTTVTCTMPYRVVRAKEA